MTAEKNGGGTARKARLRRLERIFVPTPIYFVTANVLNRRSNLAVTGVHRAFREFANLGGQRGAFVGAYVLMPDHIHLLLLWIWQGPCRLG
jgi:REP element-mobilizing transposase RayT